MKVIEITENKIGKMSECAEKMLHYGGKLMQCLEELGEGEYSEEGYGERMGQRGGRMGYRESGWEDTPPYGRESNMGYRRGSSGRYM